MNRYGFYLEGADDPHSPCRQSDKADQFRHTGRRCTRIPSPWVDCSKLSAHPAGPPFSRRNDPRSFHVLRSRQAYRKARLQRLLVLRSAVEVASMMTLMGWVRFCLRSRTAWQCAGPNVLLVSFASVERRAQTRQRDSRRTRTGSLKQGISVPVLSSRQLSFEGAGLNSMEFPVARPCDIYGRRNGRLSRIEWLSMSRLQSHSRHRRNKISGFEMGCVESESPAMLRMVEDGVSPHRAIPRP